MIRGCSELAALEHGSKESLEELDIAALYEAALEEAQETGADDVMETEAEDPGVCASCAEQIAEELF